MNDPNLTDIITASVASVTLLGAAGMGFLKLLIKPLENGIKHLTEAVDRNTSAQDKHSTDIADHEARIGKIETIHNAHHPGEL